MPSLIARTIGGAAVALAATLSIGCGDDTTSPTSTTLTTTTEVYTGTMTVGGSGFYSFSVGGPGAALITFGSLTDASTGRPLNVAMGLGVGIPAGEGCNVSMSATAAPALTAQITSPVLPGIYCVQLSDVGNLRVSAVFGVRIVHQ
jgi:hypothetical protein